MIKFIIKGKKNPQKKTETKYYAQIAPTTPLMLPQIVKLIEKRSTVSSSDIKAVLDALQEVEAAYAARAALDARVESLRAARQSAARRASGLQALYQAGERQRDAPLQARLELAEADDALAQARMQQASASIRLYQALGGGW